MLHQGCGRRRTLARVWSAAASHYPRCCAPAAAPIAAPVRAPLMSLPAIDLPGRTLTITSPMLQPKQIPRVTGKSQRASEHRRTVRLVEGQLQAVPQRRQILHRRPRALSGRDLIAELLQRALHRADLGLMIEVNQTLALSHRDRKCLEQGPLYPSSRKASAIRRTEPAASTTNRSKRTPFAPQDGCAANTISAAPRSRAC